MLDSDYGLYLADIENNTFIEIIKDYYNDLYEIPDIHEIHDGCLEFMFDNAKRVVTYRGIKLSMMDALDILEDILIMEFFLFRKNGEIIDGRQAVLFPDLYEREGDEFVRD